MLQTQKSAQKVLSAIGKGLYSNAKIASLQVHADLCRSGFFANESKCVWEPIQVISWLGSVINTAASRIAATDERITSFQQCLNGVSIDMQWIPRDLNSAADDISKFIIDHDDYAIIFPWLWGREKRPGARLARIVKIRVNLSRVHFVER